MLKCEEVELWNFMWGFDGLLASDFERLAERGALHMQVELVALARRELCASFLLILVAWKGLAGDTRWVKSYAATLPSSAAEIDLDAKS